MRTSLSTLLKRIKHRKWHVSRDGSIRCSTGGCPLTAAGYEINRKLFWQLGGSVRGIGEYAKGAEAIGYTRNTEELIDAADSTEWTIMQNWYNVDLLRARRVIKIRREMLADLGLKEVKGRYLADWRERRNNGYWS